MAWSPAMEIEWPKLSAPKASAAVTRLTSQASCARSSSAVLPAHDAGF
jgi:hypothetical protein